MVGMEISGVATIEATEAAASVRNTQSCKYQDLNTLIEQSPNYSISQTFSNGSNSDKVLKLASHSISEHK